MNSQKLNTILLALIAALSMANVDGQSGGDNAYDFLNLTNSARVASLGGQQISLNDDDLNMVYHNPSLLNQSMDNHMVFNYVDYFMDINYGYVGYAMAGKSNRSYGMGLHYVNYGEFVKADDRGIKQGTFRAADYAFNLFYAQPILDSLFHVGVNVKPIFSDMEVYHSFALAMDAGITYQSPDQNFTAALVFKNLGFQLVKYYDEHGRENLPFEIQLGISQKLKHAPFRFSLLMHHLETPNLSYTTEKEERESTNPVTGEKVSENKFENFADNLMRHMIFGVEFLPSQNFNIRLGYNYKRRQELKIEDRTALVGFSIGAGVRISKFHISYARSSYHVAGGTNHFSVAMNLSEFSKKH